MRDISFLTMAARTPESLRSDSFIIGIINNLNRKPKQAARVLLGLEKEENVSDDVIALVRHARQWVRERRISAKWMKTNVKNCGK